MNNLIERVNLTFTKDWDFIEFIRYYFKIILLNNFKQQMSVERIMIAVNELLENYFKYSNENEISLSLLLFSSNLEFEINGCYNAERIKELDEIFSNIDNSTVDDSYLRTITTKLKDTVFLGIARIIGECGGDITYNTSIKNGKTVLTMILKMNIN